MFEDDFLRVPKPEFISGEAKQDRRENCDPTEVDYDYHAGCGCDSCLEYEMIFLND